MSFKRAREKCGMTQRELAEVLGVDQSAISLCEAGKTQPRAKLLLKPASILRCTVDELLDPDAPQS